jgi:hypothetical protein
MHSLRHLGTRTFLTGSTLALALGAAACSGLIGDAPPDGTTEPPPSTPTDFHCDEDLVQDSLPLRRLSLVQYRNTVRDLVRFVLPADAEAIDGELTLLFDALPEDRRVGPDKHYAGFTHLDQDVQQDHIDASYDVAIALGASLTASSARLETVVGACATDADEGNDDACLDDFIRRFGERALRRAVSDEDVAFYRSPAGDAPFDAPDYADAITLLLTAPHMLYFVEHGQESPEERVALDAYEIASRLSYHFWQTLPDEELFEAARSGALLDEEGFTTQVDRVWADPRTRDAVGSFFAEWLDNTTLEELDSRVGTPVFDSFAGDFTPGPELRERMLAEVTDAATYYAFEGSGSFGEFLSSTRSFAKTDDLASIYGVAPWSGEGEPPALGPERVGLITRAAYLATGSANTRPIMKGVFLRKALLCDDIPPPPPNAAANPPMLSDSMSTREVVEELTGDGVCAGCHTTVINPLGFATENFDALGRVRSEQVLYDEDTGEAVGSAPIDTETVPTVDGGDGTVSSGAADLMGLILASEKPAACFARQYFRFTFGRVEDLDKDACVLESVKDTLDEDKPLAEVLRTVALTAAFRQRTFGGEP